MTDAINERIQSAAKLRGYSTTSAFLRAAIKKELDELAESSAPNEKILGNIKEVRQDVRRVERAQQVYLLWWTAWRRSSLPVCLSRFE